MRIPLPDVVKRGIPQAHPYPIQIGMQTKEFLQGALFLAIFRDLATGAYVRQSEGNLMIEHLLKTNGLQDSHVAEAWQIVARYKPVFEGLVLQEVLVSLCSHWDWYVRKLAEFLVFALSAETGRQLTGSMYKDLRRADKANIVDQISLFERASGVQLLLDESDRVSLHEMTLVRNLGLHNRWEVDDLYLSKTERKNWNSGEIRIVPIEELRIWHSLMRNLLTRMSIDIAKRFVSVPHYATP
jgi:hypothetical protein